MLNEYLENAKGSSQRSRILVFVIAFASIVAFASAISTRPNAWLLKRIDTARTAMVAYEKRANSTTQPAQLTQEENDALVWAANRRLRTTNEVYDVLVSMERARTENLLFVRLPFFGISFDTNDLGIVAGLAFSVMLLLLRHSSSREFSNLEITFNVAEKEGKLRETYELLSMTQVLTTPPSLLRHQPAVHFWRIAAKSLMLLPAFAYLLICLNDFTWTRRIALISDLNTSILAVFEFLSLLIIGLLTYSAISLSLRVDDLWAQKWKALQ